MRFSGVLSIFHESTLVFREPNTILNASSASLLRACVSGSSNFSVDFSDGSGTVSVSDTQLFNEGNKVSVSNPTVSFDDSLGALNLTILVDNDVVSDMDISEALLRVGGRPVAKKVFPVQIKTSANSITFKWQITAEDQ